MKYEPLKTYLEAHRRRTGLSQKELGFLLGGMCGKTVRRHERGTRDPNLRSVLIYEFVLGVAVKRLFKGDHLRIKAEIEPRIRGLIRSLRKTVATKRRDAKIQHLTRLLDEQHADNSQSP